MTVSACLRIVLNVNDEQFAKLEKLGPLVTKVTSAFLESRWSWPKRFEPLSTFSFMLTDPKATTLDVERLETLADELQLKLFGADSVGGVSLLLHDGEASETTRFVGASNAIMKQVAKSPETPAPFGGRVLTIDAETRANGTMLWTPLMSKKPATPSSRLDAAGEASSVEFTGVYFTARQAFIGNGVWTNSASALRRYSLVDGPAAFPTEGADDFDLTSLIDAVRIARNPAVTGAMFLPIAFSALARSTGFQSHEEVLEQIAQSGRKELVAVVYDVPRQPSFQVVPRLKRLRDLCFSFIDLQVADPDFEVEILPEGLINSVTYRLPEADERARLLALKRFMERREARKRRKVWSGITYLQTRAELLHSLQEQAHFLSGPAICGALARPISPGPWDAEDLPMSRVH